MELDINGTMEPLLEDHNGYNEINSLSILDGLKCVSYRETIVIPRIIGKKKSRVVERVKVIEDFDNNVPNKYVYEKKVLPSMRSLQFGGKPIEISPNRLYNCAYLPVDHIDAFSEIMFLLLSRKL